MYKNNLVKLFPAYTQYKFTRYKPRICLCNLIRNAFSVLCGSFFYKAIGKLLIHKT